MATMEEITKVEDALFCAARKLSKLPELKEQLTVFKNHWGLDAYSPPEDVQEVVRNIVAGMVRSAEILSKPADKGSDRG